MSQAGVLGEVLRAAAIRLRADLEESRETVEHNASRGSIREAALRDLIQKHFPTSYRAVNAEILSADGTRSKEMDLVIYNAAQSLRLPKPGNEFETVLAENALAAVQVKTRLTKGELEDACDNLRSASTCPRTEYDQDPNHQVESYMGHSPLPLRTFIFAYESSVPSPQLLDHFVNYVETWPVEHVPCGVTVLDRYHIGWFAPPFEGIGVNRLVPTAESMAISLAETEDGLALLMFLSDLLDAAAWGVRTGRPTSHLNYFFANSQTPEGGALLRPPHSRWVLDPQLAARWKGQWDVGLTLPPPSEPPA